jgi:hypothetical protein
VGLVSQAQRLAQWSNNSRSGLQHQALVRAFFQKKKLMGRMTHFLPQTFQKKHVLYFNLEFGRCGGRKNRVRCFFTKKSHFNQFLTQNT